MGKQKKEKKGTQKVQKVNKKPQNITSFQQQEEVSTRRYDRKGRPKYTLKEKVKNVVDKISNCVNHLNDYFECTQGYIPYRLSDLIRVYGPDLGNEIKEKRLWHAKEKSEEYFIREIYGQDISKYN